MDSVPPKAARVRKLGTAAVPTTARALLRMKTRRVMDIRTTQFSVTSYELLAKSPQVGIEKQSFTFFETPANPAASLRSCLHPAVLPACSAAVAAPVLLALPVAPRSNRGSASTHRTPAASPPS